MYLSTYYVTLVMESVNPNLTQEEEQEFYFIFPNFFAIFHDFSKFCSDPLERCTLKNHQKLGGNEEDPFSNLSTFSEQATRARG